MKRVILLGAYWFIASSSHSNILPVMNGPFQSLTECTAARNWYVATLYPTPTTRVEQCRWLP